ncbi:hypothetical protein F5888DRAFT_1750535 [Russula emetica]|nr:hypothetical protein F5888DRAFT_1750535 [Russula emetica]
MTVAPKFVRSVPVTCPSSVHWTVHKQACKSPTESSTSTEGPFVLLLSLSNPDLLASISGHAISALRSKVRIIQALNARKALQYLADTNLKGVFVADEGLIESENSEVLSSLIGWVITGGIAVVGGLFPSFISWDEFDWFFEKWGLPWKMGEYCRTTFVLNPSIRRLSSHSANLDTSYSMKAVHLKGVKAKDVLYASPTEEEEEDSESDVESRVSPLVPPTGSTSVILAMLRL